MAGTSMAERDYDTRAFTIAVGGAKSGKATLLLALCRLLRDSYSLAVVTADVSPSDDGVEAFLIRHKALARARLGRVAHRGSVADACEPLMEALRPELLFIESDGSDGGHVGDAADFTIHVVEATSESIPPAEWADIAESDLLVINKTQPGPPVDVSHNAVARESSRLRGGAPFVLAQIRYGIGVMEIARHLLVGWRQATTPAVWGRPTAPDASEVYSTGR